jgi:hypothetical protein
MQKQMQHPAEPGMDMRGGPKHVHASRDGRAVVRIIQQRPRDVDELLQLIRQCGELERVAHSREQAVEFEHLDLVIQLRANMRHRLIHAQ